MNGLFEGGDPDAGPADSLRVVTLLDRGVQEARVLDGEPAIQARALPDARRHLPEARATSSRADSLLRRSLDVRAAGSTRGRSADVARSLVALGLLRADQSQLDEAEKLVREGLDEARRAEASRAGGGRARHDRARRRCWRRAATTTTRSRRSPRPRGSIRWRTSRRATLSATLTELANSHFYAGNYAVSDSLNRRVLELDRGLYGDAPPARRRRPHQPRRGPAGVGALPGGRALLPRGARRSIAAGTASSTSRPPPR